MHRRAQEPAAPPPQYDLIVSPFATPSVGAVEGFGAAVAAAAVALGACFALRFELAVRFSTLFSTATFVPALGVAVTTAGVAVTPFDVPPATGATFGARVASGISIDSIAGSSVTSANTAS